MKTQKKANHKKWLASLMPIFLMCSFATYAQELKVTSVNTSGSVDTDDTVDFSVKDDQVTMTFKTTGTYNLAVTFTDSNGLTHHIEKQFNVTTLLGEKREKEIDSVTQDPSEEDRTVELKHCKITESDGINIVEATTNRDKTHMLMQFENEPSIADIAKLKQQGINLLNKAADFSYWVSINGNSTASQKPKTIQTAGGIKWAWIPTPECKKAEAIDNNDFPDNTKYDDGTVRVHIMVFDDVLQADVEKAINDLTQKNDNDLVQKIEVLKKIEVLEWNSEDVLVVVRTPLEAIDYLAALDEVKWIEPAPPPNTIDSVNVVNAIAIGAEFKPVATGTTFSSRVCVSNWKATLNESDTVDIQGTINVDLNDVGETVDMVVVARQPLIDKKSQWFMLNTEKVFVPWDDFDMTTLEPFIKDDSLTLEAVQSVNIFQSSSLPMGIWSMYFGYRLPDGTVVVNSQPIDMTIK
jgi:hypothetical protein